MSVLLKIGTALQSLGLENQEKKVVDIISKALAVAVYIDYEAHPSELRKAGELISEQYREKENVAQVIFNEVILKLESYKKKKSVMIKDEIEVCDYILEKQDWKLVEMIEEIFKADGNDAEEEKTFLSKVIEIKYLHIAVEKAKKERLEKMKQLEQGEENV